MTRHATSLARLAVLTALRCVEAVFGVFVALVDRAARVKPEGESWQDEDTR